MATEPTMSDDQLLLNNSRSSRQFVLPESADTDSTLPDLLGETLPTSPAYEIAEPNMGALIVEDKIRQQNDDSGFANQLFGSLEQTIFQDNPRLSGRAIEGMGRVTGIDAMKEFGENIVREFDESPDKERFMPRVASYRDVDGLNSALDYMGSTLGQGLGSITMTLGGAAVGAGAGAAVGSVVPGAGTAAGAVSGGVAGGAAASSFLLNYGDTYEYLMEQEGMDADEAANFALVPGSIMAALDAFAVGKLLTPVKQNVASNVIRRTGQLAKRGAGLEAVTEAAQQVVQESAGELAEATGKAPNDIEFRQRFDNTVNAFIAGGLTGGVVGAATSPFQVPTEAKPEAPPPSRASFEVKDELDTSVEDLQQQNRARKTRFEEINQQFGAGLISQSEFDSLAAENQAEHGYLQTYIEFYESDAIPKIQSARYLERLRKDLSEGTINQNVFNLKSAYLSGSLRAVTDLKDEKKFSFYRDRQTGADIIREKLIAARRRGEVEEDVTEMTLWLLDKNPSIAKNLSISVIKRPDQDKSTAGQYHSNPIGGLMRVFKGDVANRTTAVHEILHHTERTLPENIRQGIWNSWTKSISNELANADELGSAYLRWALGEEVSDPKTNEKINQKRFVEAIYNQRLPRTYYQYVNPSEFWAVNASRIVQGRFDARKAWTSRARVWLSEFIETAKGAFGLRSDSAILVGLKSVMDGDGTFVSKDMLSGGTIFRDVDENGQPILQSMLDRVKSVFDKPDAPVVEEDQPGDPSPYPTIEEFEQSQYEESLDTGTKKKLSELLEQIEKLKESRKEKNLEKVKRLSEQLKDDPQQNLRVGATEDLLAVRSRPIGEIDYDFQSILGESIDALKQDKIGIDQVIPTLKSTAKNKLKSVLTESEIKFVGIQRFVDQKKAEGQKSITKQELQEYFETNKVDLEDKVQVNQVPPSLMKEKQRAIISNREALFDFRQRFFNTRSPVNILRPLQVAYEPNLSLEEEVFLPLNRDPDNLLITFLKAVDFNIDVYLYNDNDVIEYLPTQALGHLYENLYGISEADLREMPSRKIGTLSRLRAAKPNLDLIWQNLRGLQMNQADKIELIARTLQNPINYMDISPKYAVIEKADASPQDYFLPASTPQAFVPTEVVTVKDSELTRRGRIRFYIPKKIFEGDEVNEKTHSILSDQVPGLDSYFYVTENDRATTPKQRIEQMFKELEKLFNADVQFYKEIERYYADAVEAGEVTGPLSETGFFEGFTNDASYDFSTPYTIDNIERILGVKQILMREAPSILFSPEFQAVSSSQTVLNLLDEKMADFDQQRLPYESLTIPGGQNYGIVTIGFDTKEESKFVEMSKDPMVQVMYTQIPEELDQLDDRFEDAVPLTPIKDLPPVARERQKQKRIEYNAFARLSRRIRAKYNIPEDTAVLSMLNAELKEDPEPDKFGDDYFFDQVVNNPSNVIYMGSKFDFNGSHFFKNDLIHVRFKKRIDQNGKVFLFIEEIQSDWHQSGRIRGYTLEQNADLQQKSENQIKDFEMELQSLIDRFYSANLIQEPKVGGSDFEDFKYSMIYTPQHEQLENEYRDSLVFEGTKQELESRGLPFDEASIRQRKSPFEDELARYFELVGSENISIDGTALGEGLYFRVKKRLEEQEDGPVPPAPLSKTKEWASLGIRYMLRYAAENDFDGVALTHGLAAHEQIQMPRKSAETFYDKTLPSLLKKLSGKPLKTTVFDLGQEGQYFKFNNELGKVTSQVIEFNEVTDKEKFTQPIKLFSALIGATLLSDEEEAEYDEET